MKGFKSDADTIEESVVQHWFASARLSAGLELVLDGFGRRTWRSLIPESAVPKDFLNHIGLAFVDE